MLSRRKAVNRLVYIFRTPGGLQLKRIHYGLLLDDVVYRLQYQAPVEYYFNRYLETFEQVRGGMRFGKI
jgi:hypothetical protein